MRKPYPDDLTDEEWSIIEPYFQRKETRGRKSKYPSREMINAIFYLLRTGCSWRHLPHEFPPWKTVFTYFYRLRNAGVFEKLHLRLVALSRVFSGRDIKVSGAIVDSQSIKTAHGGIRGYCGAKRVNGRKRHILTDTEGNLLGIHVSAANENDRNGLETLLKGTQKRGFNPKKNLGRQWIHRDSLEAST